MKSCDDSVYVIAEAGVNHNGDVERALEMIDAAIDAGANAIKFQTFVPQALASADAAKADYQQRNEPRAESQLAMLERLAIDFDSHIALLARCQERGIDFLSSPFDLHSADFLLHKLELQTIKLGSGELTNAPLVWRLAASDAKLILSTGMATLDEIRVALGVCSLARRGRTPTSAQQCLDAFHDEAMTDGITLMHCTTEYPCPVDKVNLRAMDTLHAQTGLPVGYSDHTRGIAVSVAAAARGARVIEKHFTLDRRLPGPDHAASLHPDELTTMIDMIREVSRALGSADKQPTDGERHNAGIARKSLIAAAAIRRGERFSEHNMTSKRPGNGLPPLHYWSLLGKPAARDYAPDELIDGAAEHLS